MNADTQAPLAELLRRVGRGDEPALCDLQRQTRPWLTSSIRRIVQDPWHGEEVLQDVYTYIWLHAADYRGERGTALAWLHRLAYSRAIDRFRTARRERDFVEFNDQRGHVVPASSQPAVDIWQRLLLRRVLRELPPDQRSLVGMAFLDGFSHREIAGRTGIPLGTVKSKIRTALIRLRRAILEGEGARAS
jgi:RNA polymerase sigma-70 factor (ECF subfamily)